MEKASKAYFTDEEMKSILDLDSDYSDVKKLESLSLSASDFLFKHTGHDYSAEIEKDPTATDCATMFVKQRWYETGETYNRDYDFTFGINADIIILNESIYKEEHKDDP